MAEKPSEFGLFIRRVTAKLRWQPHRHTEIELNLVEQGRLEYLHGGETIELPVNRLAVFWAAIPHGIVRLEEGTVLHWMTLPLEIFLRMQLQNSFVDRLMGGEFLVSADEARGLIDRAQFESWRQDLFVGDDAHRRVLLLEVEARLARLCFELENGSPTRTAESEPHEPVGEDHRLSPITSGFDKAQLMARYISGHYTELLTVQQIAAAAGLHPNYAMSLFKRHFQVSMGDYLAQYRVAHSRRLLLMENLPMSEVARQAGFGSLSQFYATFHRLCGQSPGRYRRGA